jgi:hypothetical protein
VIDLTHLRAHVALVAGRADAKVQWQLIPQAPGCTVAPITCHATVDEMLAAGLERANEAGAGVYFTINETDGQGRTAGNVRAVRALAADCDDLSALRVDVLARMPHPDLVVETRPSRAQFWWLLKEGEPLDRWTAAQTRIADALGTDAHVCDLPRVMRAAGTLNTKEAAGGARARVVYVAPTVTRRSIDEIVAPLVGVSSANAPDLNAAKIVDRRPPERVKPGDRHMHLVSVAGRLRRAGCDERVILAAIKAENEGTPEPITDEAELSQIAYSVAKYPPAEISAPDLIPPPARADEIADWGDVMSPITEDAYVVPGLRIGVGRPALFIGSPGSGKSLASASLLISLAAGEKVWGSLDAPKRPLSVLHIDFEQGLGQVKRRYQELAKGVGLQPKASFGFLRPSWKLNRQEGIDKLTELLETRKPDVVLIDCLTAAMPGAEENKTEAATPLRALASLSETTGCVFVVIHHSRKDSPESIRGTSDIEAASGEVFAFDKENRTVRHVRTQTELVADGRALALVRRREAPPLTDGMHPDLNAICATTLTIDESRRSDKGDISRVIAAAAAQDRDVLQIVKTFEAAGLRSVATALVSRASKGLSKTAAGDVLGRLKSQGLLHRVGSGQETAWTSITVEEAPNFDGKDLDTG